jgi:aminodeoxyfutalosine synthase
MTQSVEVAPIKEIAPIVRSGRRITPDAALALLRSNDLLELGRLANVIREEKNGNLAYYNINRHINHTNVCKHHCTFCAFRRNEGDADAYTYSVEDFLKLADGAERYTEIHTVGGVNPTLHLAYYEELYSAVKAKYPHLSMKSLTAVEIHELAQQENMNYEDILKRLVAAGLDSLPGGGAEIFAERVRKLVCPEKINASQWLKVHEVAHNMGLKTNATMLYGHIETDEEVIDHLKRLRELQDRTGGFQAFIPLAYQPMNNPLKIDTYTTGMRDLKVMAISRIFLDNFPHVKAFWIMLGTKIAQLALAFGADDFDGTVTDERISHQAGATSPHQLAVEQLHRIIREAGRIPVERDTHYKILNRFDN